MKKSLFITLGLVFLLGCSGGARQGGKVEIKVAYWGGPEEIEIFESLIDDWQKGHPEINVVLQHTPYSGYMSKILTRIAGRAAPDIICSEVNLFTAFSDKDIFLDLKEFVKNDPEFSIDDFFPEIVERFTVKGKLYAIPRDIAPFACVFFNKNIFDEEGIKYPYDGWDWSEMLDKAIGLTKRGPDGRVQRYGFFAWAWQNFVYSNGGKLVDDVESPTRILLDDPQTLEGLQYFADLMNVHRVMPTSNEIKNLGMGAQQMFMAGRIAMFASGIWETPALRSVKDFDWDVAMFPKGPEGVRGFGSGGSGYCILNTTKHPKEAWEVVKALTCDEGQIMLAESGLAQPANRRIASGEHWAENSNKPSNKKMLNDAVQYVIFDPFTPKWREIQELYIGPEFDLLFNGEKTAKEAVAEILPKVNTVLHEE